ncbi:fungal specific transcription factor domain-containing protein [Hirsutella rhossiliensis]|uniref:Fungal specific transcription factor domain-containing protein n=1 Tax=Hirsutella rhossiliensis TaxID=111463 RepID=A0A9P8SJT2_9HYPO|nr:fungal specific transcription factor domain-containing protein [Hirsutella rhossiliensis]KAH0964519.1 fungal specific transcription factor domain-containing protein [Hirsutella rhossiliensis]
MFSNPYNHFSPQDDFAAPPTALDNYSAQPRFHPGSLPAYHNAQQDSAPSSAVESLPGDEGILPWGPPFQPAAPAAHTKPKRQHADDSSGTSAQVRRRRVSRACDQCNQLRTKCDGQHPCAHCIDINLACEYMREKKKRGKASRKDLAQRSAAAAAAAVHNRRQSPPKTQTPSEPSDVSKGGSRASSLPSDSGDNGSDYPPHAHVESHFGQPPDLDVMSHHPRPAHLDATTVAGYSRFPPDFEGHGLQVDVASAEMSRMADKSNDYANCPGPEISLGLALSGRAGFDDGSGIVIEGAAIGGYPMATPSYSKAACPQLRYPVLEPLVPYLDNATLPLAMACDLLDLYFSSSSSVLLHPVSPYVLGFVFRKRSFLHPTNPRKCQPALLASILWVAAQTSDAAMLTSSPPARAMVCQRLLDLTLRLLKPLVHVPTDAACSSADAALASLSLGSLGAAMPGPVGMDTLTVESGPLGGAGHVDDVVTYIHLATVASAGEYKGASLRWWNAAWSLARELKLGRELAPSQPGRSHDGSTLDGPNGHHRCGSSPSEEEREERRRIWWLLYIVDRHVALCYNRPLSLLDVECEGLLRPMDDAAWQRGETPAAMGSPARFECRGHDIFGYFLPPMTILGEIVDLHHARNHPRFGLGLRAAHDWDEQAVEIRRHIDMYEQSLARFEESHLMTRPADGVVGEHGSERLTESEVQTRIVVAYGTQIMHVLHILLAGKWDPIGLLDDHDLWISSQSFFKATRHAVSAADAIGRILEYDPGLEFMPFFFGIYLLQGSFLLLLMADKLRAEASPNVVRACETIVRAHEACVVTLSTEYQRNFNKVMRSALAVVRGRVPEDGGEQRQRWRELLGLYRWTGDGTGLAL